MEAANGDHIEADVLNIQAVSICLLEIQSRSKEILISILKISMYVSEFPAIFVKQVSEQDIPRKYVSDGNVHMPMPTRLQNIQCPLCRKHPKHTPDYA